MTFVPATVAWLIGPIVDVMVLLFCWCEISEVRRGQEPIVPEWILYPGTALAVAYMIATVLNLSYPWLL